MFLSFQWDILLLETGFLSIFLAPWQTLAAGPFVVARDRRTPATAAPVSRAGFVSAQTSSVQTDADVRRGEADQRRRFVGWLNHRFIGAPDGA